MQKYPEVPQWVYGLVFVIALGVGIGCSYAGPGGVVLMPVWSILFFTGKKHVSCCFNMTYIAVIVFSSFIAIILGFSTSG